MNWLTELFRGPGVDGPPHVPDVQADAEVGAWEGIGRWPQDDDVLERRRGPGATAHLMIEHGPLSGQG